MYRISNLTDNDDIRILESAGAFTVIEYLRDLSVSPQSAMNAYFCDAMNVRKRQVICELSKSPVTVQAGAMQWMVGDVNATTGIKGVGDLFGKAVRGKASGESAIKPEYRGQGLAREIVRIYAAREQAKGRRMLLLTCLESKVEMYRKMGFRDEGIANSEWGGEQWHEMSCVVCREKEI